MIARRGMACDGLAEYATLADQERAGKQEDDYGIGHLSQVQRQFPTNGYGAHSRQKWDDSNI